jgi:hypothetical protein
MYDKLGLKMSAIEDVFEIAEIFEESQGIKQGQGRVNFAGKKYKDNTKRRKKYSKKSKPSEKPAERSSNHQKQLQCYICSSKKHLLKDCPYNSFKKTEEKRKTNASLTKELPIWNTTILKDEESSNISALLDSGSDTSFVRSELRDLAQEIYTLIFYSEELAHKECVKKLVVLIFLLMAK